MSDRSDVLFDEIDTHRTTFKSGSGLTYDITEEFGTPHQGKPVKASANGTVVLAGVDDRILGAVHHVEPDNRVVVEDGGYVRFLGQATLNGSVVGNTGNIVKAGTPATGTGRGVVVYVGADYVWVKLD